MQTRRALAELDDTELHGLLTPRELEALYREEPVPLPEDVAGARAREEKAQWDAPRAGGTPRLAVPPCLRERDESLLLFAVSELKDSPSG